MYIYIYINIHIHILVGTVPTELGTERVVWCAPASRSASFWGRVMPRKEAYIVKERGARSPKYIHRSCK